MSKTNEEVFKSIISHAKEYGFIFQSSEIYGGQGGAWDYGPLGVELKNNIKQAWWQDFVKRRISSSVTPFLLNGSIWLLIVSRIWVRSVMMVIRMAAKCGGVAAL